MGRVSILVVSLSVFGCAKAPEPEPTVAPLAERMAQNPEWKPGDPDPVHIERVRFAPTTDPDARIQPMEGITVVRNRCEQPIAFAVGPQSGPNQEDPPLHDVGAQSAVTVWVHEYDWLFLRLPSDEQWHPAQAVSGHIIVEDPDCANIVLVQRDD